MAFNLNGGYNFNFLLMWNVSSGIQSCLPFANRKSSRLSKKIKHQMCLSCIRHVCTAQWSSLQQTGLFLLELFMLGWCSLRLCTARPCWKAGLNKTGKANITLCTLFTVHGVDMPFFLLNDGKSSASHNKAEVDFKLYSVSVGSREIKRIFIHAGVVRATLFVVTE